MGPSARKGGTMASIRTALLGKGKEKPKREEDSESEQTAEPGPSGIWKGPEGPEDPDGPGDPADIEEIPRGPNRDRGKDIKTPKISQPTPFAGKREEWTFFIIQVSRYFLAYPDFFQEDEIKAIWFLGWFEGDAPKAWATAIMVTAGTGIEHPGIKDWVLLLQEATQMWGPIAPEEEAMRKMRTLKQWGSVAEYHAQFIPHAFASGHNDRAQADAFYNGLKTTIKDMMVNTERPKTLAKTLALALTYEARILARAAERRSETRPGFIKAKATKLEPKQLNEYRKAGKCFECGKIGHIARNCAQKKKKPAQANKASTEDLIDPKFEEGEEKEEQDFPED